jgi:hypothetical protein
MNGCHRRLTQEYLWIVAKGVEYKGSYTHLQFNNLFKYMLGFFDIYFIWDILVSCLLDTWHCRIVLLLAFVLHTFPGRDSASGLAYVSKRWRRLVFKLSRMLSAHWRFRKPQSWIWKAWTPSLLAQSTLQHLGGIYIALSYRLVSPNTPASCAK